MFSKSIFSKLGPQIVKLPPELKLQLAKYIHSTSTVSQRLAMGKQGPRPLVLCGPSGSGKSTLLKKLMGEFPDTFGFSTSHTTRKPRPGEVDGVHYHYVSFEYMEQAIKKGDFIESATFSGNVYGTSFESVKKVQTEGKVCVLDIEIEGVKQIKKSHLNALFVFIEPPSLQELERRLKGRNTETAESLKKRLDTAKTELVYGSTPGNFDIVVHNSNVDKAYQNLRDFVVKELEAQQKAGVVVSLKRDPNFK